MGEMLPPQLDDMMQPEGVHHAPRDVASQSEAGVRGRASGDHVHRGVNAFLVGDTTLRGLVEILVANGILVTADEESGELTIAIDPAATPAIAGVTVGTAESNFEIESDGSVKLNGNATEWEDLFFPIAYAKVPAVNAPNWESFAGNLNEYTFAVNDLIEFGAQEITHAFKEGSTATLHVHWATNGLEGSDTAVRWEIEYTIVNGEVPSGIGGAFPTPTVVAAEQVIPANTPDLSHMTLQVADIAAADLAIGAAVKMRVRRIAKTGAEANPAADPFGLMVGIHIEMDTLGSRQEFTK